MIANSLDPVDVHIRNVSLASIGIPVLGALGLMTVHMQYAVQIGAE